MHDGTEVIVQVGADYAVTATVDRPQGGRGGPGNGETALTGDTAEGDAFVKNVLQNPKYPATYGK